MVSLPLFCPILLAHEYTQENQRVLKGTVSSVREDSLALLQPSLETAVQTETSFPRNNQVELINISGWDQLREGEEIILRYKEVLRIKEGKDERGGSFRESKILSRELISIEREKEENETAGGRPGILRS